jgi:signal transduction histidine kinase
MCGARALATIRSVTCADRHLTRTRQGLAGLGVVIVAALAPLILFTSAGPDAAGAKAAAVALVIIQAATFVWMPTRPELAMSVSIAAGVGIEQLCPDLGFLGVANISLSALSWLRPPRVSLWVLGVMIALSPLELATGGGATGMAFAIGGAVLAWTWGELWRTRRGRRRDAARRALADERARIARELHDVVAHNVSLIVVQAVAADDAFDDRPEVARQALRTIEQSGRDALAELRRLLQTMRPDVPENGAPEPQPGLDRLDALAAAVEAAGLRVVIHREGDAVALPAGVDLSAYRIVQEALTNALRHARATRAEVTVRYAPAAVSVEVSDDGVGGPADASDGGHAGHGIVGMRERAALVGGTLEAGAPPNGDGFRVRAELPLGART